MSENQASQDVPPSIDPVAAQRWLQSSKGQASWLSEEVGKRMHDRLQWIRLQPQRWLDWLPLLGGLAAHQLVTNQYLQAQVFVHESTPSRFVQVRQQLAGNWTSRWLSKVWPQKFPVRKQALPEDAQDQVDLLWSNMTLHLAPKPLAWLQRWHDLLKVDGFVMFSCLGPDTLQELRHAFAQRGWSAPLHDLTDMHDWGDMLVQAGFSEPVMDMEKITLTYQSSADLLRDLRACGRNMARGRSQTVFSRHWLDTFLEVFEQLRQAQGGEKVHLTVEVIYGHAIKPMPRLNVGETTNVSLQQMKQLLGQKKAAS